MPDYWTPLDLDEWEDVDTGSDGGFNMSIGGQYDYPQQSQSQSFKPLNPNEWEDVPQEAPNQSNDPYQGVTDLLESNYGAYRKKIFPSIDLQDTFQKFHNWEDPYFNAGIAATERIPYVGGGVSEAIKFLRAERDKYYQMGAGLGDFLNTPEGAITGAGTAMLATPAAPVGAAILAGTAIPQIAHGTYQMTRPGKMWRERAEGAVELGGGIMGAHVPTRMGTTTFTDVGRQAAAIIDARFGSGAVRSLIRGGMNEAQAIKVATELNNGQPFAPIRGGPQGVDTGMGGGVVDLPPGTPDAQLQRGSVQQPIESTRPPTVQAPEAGFAPLIEVGGANPTGGPAAAQLRAQMGYELIPGARGPTGGAVYKLRGAQIPEGTTPVPWDIPDAIGDPPPLSPSGVGGQVVVLDNPTNQQLANLRTKYKVTETHKLPDGGVRVVFTQDAELVGAGQRAGIAPEQVAEAKLTIKRLAGKDVDPLMVDRMPDDQAIDMAEQYLAAAGEAKPGEFDITIPRQTIPLADAPLMGQEWRPGTMQLPESEIWGYPRRLGPGPAPMHGPEPPMLGPEPATYGPEPPTYGPERPPPMYGPEPPTYGPEPPTFGPERPPFADTRATQRPLPHQGISGDISAIRMRNIFEPPGEGFRLPDFAPVPRRRATKQPVQQELPFGAPEEPVVPQGSINEEPVTAAPSPVPTAAPVSSAEPQIRVVKRGSKEHMQASREGYTVITDKPSGEVVMAHKKAVPSPLSSEVIGKQIAALDAAGAADVQYQTIIPELLRKEQRPGMTWRERAAAVAEQRARIEAVGDKLTSQLSPALKAELTEGDNVFSKLAQAMKKLPKDESGGLDLDWLKRMFDRKIKEEPNFAEMDRKLRLTRPGLFPADFTHAANKPKGLSQELIDEVMRFIEDEEGALNINQLNQVIKRRDAQRTGGQQPPSNILKEIFDLTRGLTTTLDLSAALKQGLPMIGTRAWFSAFSDMHKVFTGERELANKMLSKIKERPNFTDRINPTTGRVDRSFAETSGIKLMKPGDPLSVGEEYTLSTRIEKTPVLGKAFKRSNDSYVAFLNELRSSSFDNLIEAAGGRGKVDPFQAKEIADFVMIATGRGPLKVTVPKLIRDPNTKKIRFLLEDANFEKAASTLNALMFAPRLQASRVQMLNPATYVNASPFVRKQYIKAFLRGSAAAGTFLTLAKLGGAEVSTDPLSADFMKARIGNTRIDPGAGFQQYHVTMARLMLGQTTSSGTGQRFEFGQTYRGPTRFEALQTFAMNKAHPSLKWGIDMLQASKYRPVNVMDRTAQAFAPMIIGDAVELLKEDPAMAPIVLPLVFYGMSSQTYERGQEKGTFIPRESDVPWTGGMFPYYPNRR